MAQLAVRVAQITESPIRAMVTLAEGVDGVTPLHAGEPDFNTPAAVIEAAKIALDQGWTKYSGATGILPLREALATYDAPKLGRRPNPRTEVMVTLGGTNALFLAMMSLLNPGDEVLVPNPGWPPYTEMVRMAGAVPIYYDLDPSDEFRLDRQSVLDALTVRTRAIIVSSPNNPTGTMLDGDELGFLAEMVRRNDLWVISDEVYEKILFDGRKHYSIAALEGMAERTVVVGSFSKTWAMTGWRLGHLTGPAPVIAAAAKLQGTVNSCPNAFVQVAGIRAVQMPEAEMNKMVSEFQRRRDIFVNAVGDIADVGVVKPHGTFFILMDVRKLGRPDTEIAERLFHSTRVTSIGGSGFGSNGAGFLRFSVVRSPDEIRDGLAKVGGALRQMAATPAAA
jgi:aspartate/methionine/tyrosine aminotransferase